MDKPPGGRFGSNLGGARPDSYHREALPTILVRQLLNVRILIRGRRVFSAGEWKRENLSTVEASRQNFPQAFTEAMTNAKKINFDITRLDINRAWREGSSLPSGNNYTNYEFYQIMTNPKWLAKTTFYRWENDILKGFSATEIEILYPMLP